MPLSLRVDLPNPFKCIPPSSSEEKRSYAFDPIEASRLGGVALNFLRLHKGAAGVIDLGSKAFEGVQASRTLATTKKAFTRDEIVQVMQIAKSVGFIALALINAPLSNMVETAFEVGKSGYQSFDAAIYQRDVKKCLEELIKCMGSSLNLGVQLYGGLELTVLSMLVRVLLTFYAALDDILKNQGTIRLEALANIALGSIYMIKLAPQIEILREKFRILRDPEFQTLLGHIRAAQKASQGSFREMIEKTNSVKDEVFGSISLGAHKGNMGGHIVYGGNISVRERNIEGEIHTELEFKLNAAQRDEVQTFIDQLQTLPQDKIGKFLNYAGVNGQGVSVQNVSYEYLAKQGEKFVREGSIEIGNAYKINVHGVGDILIGSDPYVLSLYDRVVVRLNGKKDASDMGSVLALLGLEKAILPSTSDEIERLKIAMLFQAYHPREATLLTKEKEFYTSSLKDLKARVEQIAPDMQEKLKNDLPKMVAEETLPGRIRYSIPDLAEKAKEAGAVGLLAGVGGGDTAYSRFVSMLSLGALSSQVRFDAGMIIGGASSEADHYMGSAEYVFTRLIPKSACDNEFPIDYLPFAGDLQVIYSTNLLNRGTFQYHYDNFGSKQLDSYLNRPDILSFVKQENADFNASNEVMVKDRIPPNLIMGCIVPTVSAKNEVLQRFYEHDRQESNPEKHIIKIDALGKQVINGIAIDKFVQVGTTLSKHLFSQA